MIYCNKYTENTHNYAKLWDFSAPLLDNQHDYDIAISSGMQNDDT